MKEKVVEWTQEVLEEAVEASSRWDAMSHAQREVERLHDLAGEVEKAGGTISEEQRNAIDELASAAADESDEETVLRGVSKVCASIWQSQRPEVMEKLPPEVYVKRHLGGYVSDDE